MIFKLADQFYFATYSRLYWLWEQQRQINLLQIHYKLKYQ